MRSLGNVYASPYRLGSRGESDREGPRSSVEWCAEALRTEPGRPPAAHGKKIKGMFEGNAAEPYAGEKTTSTFDDNVITPDSEYGSEDLRGSMTGCPRLLARSSACSASFPEFFRITWKFIFRGGPHPRLVLRVHRGNNRLRYAPPDPCLGYLIDYGTRDTFC
jgi:hypothetical protein